MHQEFADGWKSMLPMESVDCVVDSCEEGIRKPDPAIFRLTLERLGLGAPECLFLDDVPSNTRSASELGIQTITVTPDPAETVRAVQQLLKLGA